MRGKRGIWTVGIVLLVALLLGVATIPLMKERRRREVSRTKAVISAMSDACKQYQLDHAVHPGQLESYVRTLMPVNDGWGRPLTVRMRGNQVEIRSLGPDPHDPTDDIVDGGSLVP